MDGELACNARVGGLRARGDLSVIAGYRSSDFMRAVSSVEMRPDDSSREQEPESLAVFFDSGTWSSGLKFGLSRNLFACLFAISWEI